MRDNKSFLLALLAAGLVITWVYHIYDKSQYSNHTREVFIKDSIAVAEAVSDSLRIYYTHTLDQLGDEKLQIDSTNSSLKGELGQKITEINKLRSEIGTILKRKNLTQADLTEAKTKIDDLQIRIDDLKTENTSLNDERTKLNGVLAQLNGEMNSLQQNMQKVNAENKNLTQKINDASVFIASEIKFVAVDVKDDEKESETTQQKKANKFVTSFTVQNNILDLESAEVVVVVTDPSGKSLNTEVWDAGSFETKTDGRKIYTRKVKFEYNKGEAKHLIFSLEPDSFEKGTYKLSLYHNGIRIGESSWKLG
jgi:predicted  nucleic acid-binding Zn-ribbon protein